MSEFEKVLIYIDAYVDAYRKHKDDPAVETYVRGALDALWHLKDRIRAEMNPLPDGTCAVSFDPADGPRREPGELAEELEEERREEREEERREEQEEERRELGALPEGVTIVGLENVKHMHSALKRIFGE